MPAYRIALSATIAALVLLALPGAAVRAADATSFDTKTLAHQTRRLLNDAGQFYLAWWIPQGLSQALMRDTSGISPADSDRMLRALEPYIVFAVSRGQEGAEKLEDVHDRADLLSHSRLSVDGQTMTAVPADQNDPGVRSALDVIRPALASMLGRNGYGIEFALYRLEPGMHALDPTMPGNLEYTLYRKRFVWKLPVWASLTPAPAPPPVFVPVPVRAAAAPVPAAAGMMPSAPVTSAPPGAAAAATPASAPAAAPVHHRKVDPVTGEEFPERYDYNPYSGQKLVSQ
ncbi:MAG: hypothetical protein ACHQIL_01830 [Steroidobacterales bacterium]